VTPYYEDDTTTIYHGDCREVLPRLASVDAIFTDPPYGVGVRYDGDFDDSRSDYWPWFRDVLDVMKTSAPLVVFTHRVGSLKEITGWDWVGCWYKPRSAGGRVGNSCLFPHWEPIFMYGVHAVGAPLKKYTSDVFERASVPVAQGGVTKGRETWATVDVTGHPCPKPLPLFIDLLSTLGQGADLICDPFMGGGTTLRAAKDLGRRSIGIEQSERYCEIAAKRLGQEVLDFGGAA